VAQRLEPFFRMLRHAHFYTQRTLSVAIKPAGTTGHRGAHSLYVEDWRYRNKTP